MARLKPLPRSRAKTAYDLVSDVIRAILAEPKRVDMGVYRDKRLPEDGGPACGTVACFAGWVNILAGNHGPWGDIDAEITLGVDLNYYTAGEDGWYVFNAGGGGDIKGRVGTKQYAYSVVKRIRKFQRINAKALKAKVL
jgi:hypothetical protein